MNAERSPGGGSDGSCGASTHLRVEPSILYFGTPVLLVSSLNADGTANLAPMSSAWALGWTVVLGLGLEGHTISNLRREGELVIHLSRGDLWQHVERLAGVTGANPVPDAKQGDFAFEPDKFGIARLTAVASDTVRAPRVGECPLQLEATVACIRTAGADDSQFALVETRVTAVHAAHELVIAGTNRIHPQRWTPLLYVFRHYFSTGPELGRTFRADPLM